MVCTLWIRLAVILSVLIIITVPGAATPQAPQRKNIDLLTPAELAAYEHAIQILKDRSVANPHDKTGYLWQAWIHNCPFIWQPPSGVGTTGSHGDDCDFAGFPPEPGLVAAHPGVCEHGKDLFLVWHRAEFYYFEQILRTADPDGTVTDSRGVTGPSTRDVAVPFWNWTRPSTGNRYPKAFEVTTSPLYHINRNHDALTDLEKVKLQKVTNPLAVAALVYDPDWENFGGYPQEAPVGGDGRFESEHHNTMHSLYVGGDMGNSSRAALDPVFFSFHAYIDLVFQFWLDEHGIQSVTSLNHFLRAAQPSSVTPPPGHVQGAGLPSMGQTSIYLDLANLGYRYEVTAEDRLPRPEAVTAALAAPSGAPAPFAATEKSRHARLSGDGLFDPRAGPATMTSKVAVRIPNDVGKTRAAFRRPHDAPDVSFTVDFYLHPADVDLDLAKKADREKYIVVTLARLGRGSASAHGGHGPDKPLYADLTGPLKDLAATGHGGETWSLTAVVSGQAPSPTFGTLSLVP
jgi:tyrosinase